MAPRARSSRFRGSGNQPKDEILRKDVLLLHHVSSYFVLLLYIIKLIQLLYSFTTICQLELFDETFY